MKKIFNLIMVAMLFVTATYSQEKNQQHKGFYLSMGLGPAFGNINLDSNEEGKSTMSGTGAVFDFKIGGAIKENLILHATLFSNGLVGPKVTNSFGSGKATDNVTISEAMIGGGITYYIMPQNLFISGSLGSGVFAIDNQDTGYKATTDRGLSFQLKIGKEWWVSRKWGLGAAVAYGHTNVDSNPNNTLNEKMNSNRFSIMFNATLN